MTISKLTERHQNILNFLGANPGRKTTKAIYQAVGKEVSLQSVYKDLKELVRAGYLKEPYVSAFNEKHYELAPMPIEVIRQAFYKEKKELPEVTTQGLLGFLDRFGRNAEYETKVQQHAWKLPYTITQLYTALARQAVGENTNLDPIKTKLAELHAIVTRFGDTLESLLSEERLWDQTEFATLLLGGAPVELIQDLIERAQSNWNEVQD